MFDKYIRGGQILPHNGHKFLKQRHKNEQASREVQKQAKDKQLPSNSIGNKIQGNTCAKKMEPPISYILSHMIGRGMNR